MGEPADVLRGRRRGWLTERSTGFLGSLHSGHRFGAALLEIREHDGDGSSEPNLLFVGAPGADTAKGRDSGSVSWVRESQPASAPRRQGYYTGSRGKPGAALGTALGQAFSEGTEPGSTRRYVLASAPGGLRGVVYASRFELGDSPTSGHLYANSGTESNVYGTAVSNVR